MDFLLACIDFILHLNLHLAELIQIYGTWVYAILFVIVFTETGLVVMPFLPGDSLLFAAGSLSAVTVLNPHLIVIILIVACTLGDNVNYGIGRLVGKKLLLSGWISAQHAERARLFYEKHGGTAILLARFVPIVRTFMPFTAGVSGMTYPSFVLRSLCAAIIWVAGLTYLGFYCGNLPWVKQNFAIIMVAIIMISILPIVLKCIKSLVQSSGAPG